MQIKLDFRSGVPIYLQIAEQVKQMVAQGKLKPGDQLPTVRQLATDLRVNFNTVARAYHFLDEAGVISTQHGRGTYIWEPLNGHANQKIREESLAALTEKYFEDVSLLSPTPKEVLDMLMKKYHEWEKMELSKREDEATQEDSKS